MIDESWIRGQVRSAYAAVDVDDGGSAAVLDRAIGSIHRRRRRRRVTATVLAALMVAGIGYGLTRAATTDPVTVGDAVERVHAEAGSFGNFGDQRVVSGAGWKVRVPTSWSADVVNDCLKAPALVLRPPGTPESPCDVAKGRGGGIRLTTARRDGSAPSSTTTEAPSAGLPLARSVTYDDREYQVATVGSVAPASPDLVAAIVDSASPDVSDGPTSPQTETDVDARLAGLRSGVDGDAVSFVYPQDATGWRLQLARTTEPTALGSLAEVHVLSFLHGFDSTVYLCSGESEALGFCAPQGETHTVQLGLATWACDDSLRCRRATTLDGLYVGVKVERLVETSVLSDLMGSLQLRSN